MCSWRNETIEHFRQFNKWKYQPLGHGDPISSGDVGKHKRKYYRVEQQREQRHERLKYSRIRFQIYCFTLDFMSTSSLRRFFFATRLSQGALPWIWLSPSLILRLQFTYMTIWMKVALHDFKFALVWEVAFDLELVRGLTFQHKHPLRRYSKAFRNKNLSMNTPTKSADGDTLPIDIESLSFITKYNH